MTTITPTAGGSSGTGRAKTRRPRRKGLLLHIYTWLVIAWLVLPIAVMILFGFNDTHSKFNFQWEGFTLHWYRHLFDREDLTTSLINSLVIALASTAITTVLGTLAGLALGRYSFRGQGVANLVMFAAISSPELVMGASLLSMFVTLNTPRGYGTILVSHVMFSIAFVAMTVRARAVGLDPSIEEAARDLGAGPWTTFRLVTLPLIMPGVISGALLAFALSIDDFVITNFTSGSTVTFPLWVWGSTRTGTPPQVNVMGTLLFAAGVLIAVLNLLASRRRARRA
ncbi:MULTISPECIES: ABC transporter permease [Thermomonospora]|uniref:Binding-protein-dependent transport systems inner membrane component n=1 Tax=Thermomonospora curvata (strain ATCC 19995 / DSM 43183 / JCM 3096 / KCTC 9072 / NBRC 15933 / NCIMB 10081 / Henssen B9) TaxID=471852 RepID=D1AAY8_THECD|nr:MULTISPECIES: ABC transporter permease [Thermomonospora]ACY98931.1 binding-protein-dependent transport systems inner membrane component [Thermomonospora curvata DSM 43183]PKK13128.1 MAG: ABC transporter permease [Thermomonospora sp. CIF 1]